jgi:hypothetical protein
MASTRPWSEMTEFLMQRLHALCQLKLVLERANLRFPLSGDIFLADGMVTWSATDDGELYVLMPLQNTRASRGRELQKAALAASLLSFVVHVPALDLTSASFIECMLDPEAITAESVEGMTSEPLSSVNVRMHVDFCARPAEGTPR